MKRTLSLILSMVLLVGLFVGCSDNSTGSDTNGSDSSAATESTASTSTDKEITLEIWVGPDWQGVYEIDENAEYGAFWTYVAEEYHKENPNVTVNPSVIEFNQRVEKLSIAAQSNSLPNMYFESLFSMGDYIHEGLMEPVTDIITDEDRADIPESLFNECTVNGEIYFFPFYVELGLMGVDVTLFEEAGVADVLPEGDVITWTPDEFRACLEAIKDKLPDVYPFAMWCADTNGDTWNTMYLRMFGGEFAAEDGSAITINSPEGVEALTFLKGLVDDGLVAPGAETMTAGDVHSMFMNKQVAVAGSNNAVYNQIQAGLESGSISQPLDYKFAYFPSVSDPYCFTYVKGGCLFKNDDPDLVEESKKFIKFFSHEPYTQASLLTMPARDSLIEEYCADDPNLSYAMSTLGNSMPVNNGMPGYGSARTFLFPMLQGVVTGELTDMQAAMDDYVNSANAEVSKAVERSVILN